MSRASYSLLVLQTLTKTTASRVEDVCVCVCAVPKLNTIYLVLTLGHLAKSKHLVKGRPTADTVAVLQPRSAFTVQ